MNNLLEQIKLTLSSIHGWCSFEKATALVNKIVETKPEKCVEIGVYGGSSFIPIALALKYNKKGTICGIDPWSVEAALEEMKEEANKEWWKVNPLEEIYQHCQDNIKSFGVSDYCKLIRDKAENVVNQFEDNSLDFVHIDGNHAEALSYKDVTLYLPKVKKGGIIFFDDIWWTEQNKVTTRKAILFLLDNCEKIDLVGDCMILRVI